MWLAVVLLCNGSCCSFCNGMLVLGVEKNAVVGDCKGVGKVGVSDHVALEVAEGLNVNRCVVFSQESGEGGGNLDPTSFPVFKT